MEMFESPDLILLDFFLCVVRLRPKITGERWIQQTNCWLAFWMLLAAQRNVKINSDEQHAIFTHELQSELRLAGGFWENLLWTVTDLLSLCNNFTI